MTDHHPSTHPPDDRMRHREETLTHAMRGTGEAAKPHHSNVEAPRTAIVGARNDEGASESAMVVGSLRQELTINNSASTTESEGSDDSTAPLSESLNCRPLNANHHHNASNGGIDALAISDPESSESAIRNRNQRSGIGISNQRSRIQQFHAIRPIRTNLPRRRSTRPPGISEPRIPMIFRGGGGVQADIESLLSSSHTTHTTYPNTLIV
jgi:hypothetical protein